MSLTIEEFLPPNYKKIFPTYHVDQEIDDIVYLSGLFFLYDVISNQEEYIRIVNYVSTSPGQAKYSIEFIMSTQEQVANLFDHKTEHHVPILSEFMSTSKSSAYVSHRSDCNDSQYMCYYTEYPSPYKIAAAIPAFFHQLFPTRRDKNNKQTSVPLLRSEEQRLMKALYDEDEHKLRVLFSKKFNKNSLQQLYMESKLKEFDKHMIESRSQLLDTYIVEIKYDIEQLEKQLFDMYNKMDSFLLQKCGLHVQGSQNGDKLCHFFNSIDCVDFVDIQDGSIFYDVYTTSNVNPDKLHIMYDYIDMTAGYLYHTIDAEDIDDFRLLLKNIFSESPTIGIKTYSCIKLNYQNENFQTPLARRQDSELTRPRDGYLPQPHIMLYNCFGTGQLEVQKYLSEHDVLGAIQQSVACCANLNAGEINIVASLLNRAYKNKEKIFLTFDGDNLNYQEAIDWVKERKRSDAASN